MLINLEYRKVISKVCMADIVLTDIAGYFIALSYNPEIDKAPIVLAKGKGKITSSIKKISKRKGIAIFEFVNIVKQINRKSKIDRSIPKKYYRFILAIIRHIEKYKNYILEKTKIPEERPTYIDSEIRETEFEKNFIFNCSDLIIIAGENNSERSTLIPDIALNVAKNSGNPVFIFMLGEPINWKTCKYRKKKNNHDFSNLLPIELYENEKMEVSYIEKILMNNKDLFIGFPALVIIDSFQLLISRYKNHDLKVTFIIKRLKKLAVKLNIPILITYVFQHDSLKELKLLEKFSDLLILLKSGNTLGYSNNSIINLKVLKNNRGKIIYNKFLNNSSR